MKRFMKFAFAMLTMVAMAVCVASCDKDKDDEKSGGSISYDALFDKMWVINEEQYVGIDDNGKKEEEKITDRNLLEEGVAIEWGIVRVFEKVSETSRFLQVKTFFAVAKHGEEMLWNYAAFDKTNNKFFLTGKVCSDEELAQAVSKLEQDGEEYGFTVTELTNKKLSLFIDDEGDKITDILVPESSWHGMSREQFVSKCVEYGY